MWRAALSLFLFAACAQQSPGELSVLDLDGRAVAPFRGEPGTFEVLFFVASDCPIANKFAPEIERICDEYGPRGVGFHLVYADGDEDAETIRAHITDYGFTAPALLDFEHRLVEHAGATVTPEAALFSSEGELLYRGRIDDRFVDFGKERENPTQRDLRAALDAVLAGERPVNDRTEAIGCFIPERD